MTTAGRVEARMTVPTGGAAASASNGAQTSAVTVTVPAGNYYPTAAGGVSSLLTVLQTQLNENVQGYPTAAAAMQYAVGYGTWTGGQGWLLNESSGNLVPAFGATTLTATSLTYGAGPRAGIDKAIGFDANSDNADGGNIFDVIATDDLIVAWVGYLGAVPAGSTSIITKFNATGWYIQFDAGGSLNFGAYRAGPTNDFNASLTAVTGSWYVGIATVDRGTGKARVGIRTLAGSTTVSTEQTATAASYTTAGAFRLGARADSNIADTTSQIAAVYVVDGTGVASGLSANLSTALTNFANAVNSSFTVSLGGDGRITISNSYYPSSVAFTNTTLRDVLGFEYDFDYPQTAAQVTAALGGITTWTDGRGYLCNESTGNLDPVFGSTSLTPVSTPTYSNQGARGGADKAVGLDSAADAFDGGSMLDVTGTDDLILVWVGKFANVPSGTLTALSKINAGLTTGWALFGNVTPVMQLRLAQSGNGPQLTGASAYHIGTQHIGIACIDRSTGRARLITMSLTDGTQQITTEFNCGATSFTTADSFRIGASAWVGTLTGFQCSALYAVSGPGVATGLSAGLAAAATSFAAYMKGQTGTQQARGLWFPDCTIDLEGDPERAPTVTDSRSSMSPTGQVLTLVGNTFRRHRGIVWSHVPIAQVWDAEATYENASWEEFLIDTQFGLGHSWFTPGSPIQIYDHNGIQVGVDASVAGWYMIGINSVEPRKSAESWTGLWRVEIPMIVAVGS